MDRYARWNALLELLAESGRTTVEQAAERLSVSQATIRRDFDQLAQQQMITRTRGGAVANGVSYDLPLRYKTAKHSAEKQRIGAAAAALVGPGMVVGLNGGTTTTEVARALAARADLASGAEHTPLTVVTNALNMPSLSAEEAPKLRPYMALAERLGALVGQLEGDHIKGVAIEVEGAAAELNQKPITGAVLAGLMGVYSDTVNMVNAPFLAKERGLKERLLGVLRAKIEAEEPYHRFAQLLFKAAADPQSPLNPFAPESSAVRRDAIALFAEVLSGAKVRVPKDLAERLPELLWLYEMAIILFWIFDDSEGRKRTHRLIEHSAKIVVGLVTLLRLPILRPVRGRAKRLLEELRGSRGVQAVPEGDAS